eukprot:m.165811 g.165811  ORF g.165811 m.165811 type:complete len:84 (-) comp14435_c0_seq2:776-1027(-)
MLLWILTQQKQNELSAYILLTTQSFCFCVQAQTNIIACCLLNVHLFDRTVSTHGSSYTHSHTASAGAVRAIWVWQKHLCTVIH